jgi:very-short-patch-repair endonuclease
VKLLRAYLDFAERGPEALTGAITEVGVRGFDSPFEQDVYEELTGRGLNIHSQVGCGRFRIDLAVTDPRTTGRYLLGVECDGAAYHSSATARDRDRLRQEVLEGLGWHICRVWSTDWRRNRDKQVVRVQEALAKSILEGPRTAALAREPEVPQSTVAVPVVEAPTSANYGSIDDVPELVLRESICRLLRDFGATEVEELIKTLARHLGFGRTGKRIQARMEVALEELIQVGQVCRIPDGRVRSVSPGANVAT